MPRRRKAKEPVDEFDTGKFPSKSDAGDKRPAERAAEAAVSVKPDIKPAVQPQEAWAHDGVEDKVQAFLDNPLNKEYLAKGDAAEDEHALIKMGNEARVHDVEIPIPTVEEANKILDSIDMDKLHEAMKGADETTEFLGGRRVGEKDGMAMGEAVKDFIKAEVESALDKRMKGIEEAVVSRLLKREIDEDLIRKHLDKLRGSTLASGLR